MYTPELHRERDPRRLHDLIDAYPFGTLLAVSGDGVEISHVPFLLDREAGTNGTLSFHLARANPLVRLAATRPLVAVFQGPHGYVSASWYEAPQEQVPTWNYAVVHAHGRARELARDGLRRLLTDLAAAHEDPSFPWRVEDLAPDFLEGLMREIAGFELPIDRVEGKFKLSQNRSASDLERVMRALAARGGRDDLEMLELMK